MRAYLTFACDCIYAQFSASIPGFIYAFLGTSRQLNVAPEAALSLLVGQAVNDILHGREHEAFTPLGKGPVDEKRVGAIVAGVITFQVCPIFCVHAAMHD